MKINLHQLTFGLLLASAAPAIASIVPAPISPLATIESPRGKCVDFSGKWKGKCSDGKETTTEVRQVGCNALYTEGGFYSIGGMKTSTSVSLHPAINLHLSPRQKVFSLSPAATFLPGPFYYTMNGTGVYRSRRGRIQPVVLTFDSLSGNTSFIGGMGLRRPEIPFPHLYPGTPEGEGPAPRHEIECPPLNKK